MLGAVGRWMDKALEGTRNVARHGYIDVMALIVPIESEPNVPVATPVLGAFVFLGNDSNEVVNILLVSVSYTKVVNGEGEHQITVEMLPQAGRDRTWHVSKRLEEVAKTVVGKFSCLWEAIHAFAYFSVDVAIDNFGFEFVELNDGGW